MKDAIPENIHNLQGKLISAKQTKEIMNLVRGRYCIIQQKITQETSTDNFIMDLFKRNKHLQLPRLFNGDYIFTGIVESVTKSHEYCWHRNPEVTHSYGTPIYFITKSKKLIG